MSDICVEPKRSEQVGQLIWLNPWSSRQRFKFTSEIRSSEELHMQLETNRSIEDCVFVDV